MQADAEAVETGKHVKGEMLGLLASTIRDLFSKCVTDRNDGEDSRKWAGLPILTVLLRIAFKVRFPTT